MPEVFRVRESEEIKEAVPEKPAEVTGIVEDKEEFFSNDSNELDKWETANGKYGLEYLGIKEISKEFPIKMQFQMIDKYIKEEMGDYDKTPQRWQDILKSLEAELGTDKMNAVERLKKLAGYIRVLNNFKKAKAQKELYKAFRTEFNDSQD
jgi:hypothetical protein